MPFVPHTEAEIRQMLAVIGLTSLDDLFADITPELRPRSFNVPAGKTESAVLARMEALAGKNRTDLISFLGAGFYQHAVPSVIDALTGRSEFYTAYTPYQPECSQGTLQAIFEFQTAVARLFDMECCNASVYDGGSALFEAAMMAVRHTKRHSIVVDECINPLWRAQLETWHNEGIVHFVTVPHKNGTSDMAALKAAITDNTAAVMVQNPNFFGAVEDFSELFAHARAHKVLSVISVYPVLQSVLKTPGEMGADVAVADGQSLGQYLNFGGPYLGIMTCRKDCIRQFPGRIVGRTKDVDGETGYVLTLQAREQHIRRAKATSNICSNQALCALRALIYLAVVGRQGLMRVAENSMVMARKAVEKLTAISGVHLLNDAPFGNEVALVLPKPAAAVAASLMAQGIVPGFPLGGLYAGMDNVLLLACTELTSSQQVDALASALASALGGAQ
ncbi:MAG: aminomethyl-transferring glycine dehydrogenase subunit GcvPA [Desulfovibrionaceae bacterium]|nr:aminomethyl-transferring glycine dehydrogenase subunit GcvPA [Desulfovibrionaceae bacterium]